MSGTGCPPNLGHCCGGSWCMGGNCSCDRSPESIVSLHAVDAMDIRTLLRNLPPNPEAE